MRILKILIIIFAPINLIGRSLNSPDDFILNSYSAMKEDINDNYKLIPIILSIKAYQQIVGPIKPDNCRMYPTCSYYSIDAVNKRGLFGVFMSIDRLYRCGHDLSNYKTIIHNSEVKYYDPIK